MSTQMEPQEDESQFKYIARPERRPVDQDAWVLQINLKTPHGALINIRGFNAFDLAANLEAISGMAHEILECEAAFFPAQAPAIPQALVTGLGAAPVQPQYQQAPPAPAYPQQQAPSNAPMCQHNLPAKYVAGGISKTGRPYKAFWACSLPREAQCQFRADA
jgi:hypothetical protein